MSYFYLIVKYAVIVSTLLLEFIFASSGLWVLGYSYPVLILSCILYARQDEKTALLVLLLGTVVLDLLLFRTTGLQALIFSLSATLVYVLSRIVGIFDNQSKRVKLLFVMFLYLVGYSLLLAERNVLNFEQILIPLFINMLVTATLLLIFGRKPKTHDIFKL